MRLQKSPFLKDRRSFLISHHPSGSDFASKLHERPDLQKVAGQISLEDWFMMSDPIAKEANLLKTVIDIEP